MKVVHKSGRALVKRPSFTCSNNGAIKCTRNKGEPAGSNVRQEIRPAFTVRYIRHLLRFSIFPLEMRPIFHRIRHLDICLFNIWTNTCYEIQRQLNRISQFYLRYPDLLKRLEIDLHCHCVCSLYYLFYVFGCHFINLPINIYKCMFTIKNYKNKHFTV